MGKWLKVKDICDLLQVSKSTVYDWVHQGFLPHIVIKRNKRKQTIRFSEDAVENWMKAKERETRKARKIDNGYGFPKPEGYESTTSEERRCDSNERWEACA